MKKFLSTIILLFVFLVSIPAQEIEIINEGIVVPYAVKIKGHVPNSSTCIEVTGSGDNTQRLKYDGLFLGVTAIIDGEEKDFGVRIVNGRFKEEYSISMYDMSDDIKWIACLWKGKMRKENCAMRNNGNPCQYCRKNGYHLDERVARAVLE